MHKLARWSKCSLLSSTGLAAFDGIKIQADPITDPRQDRVMPLFEEEQILMCRLMFDRLKPGDLVLDVGTGSGVFAIWAAAKRDCRVIAVDISRRAIHFARTNAFSNGVTIVPTPIRLANGTICFFRQDIADFVLLALSKAWQFDVVILNPPFNPTCPGLEVAIHASAGPKAQDPFVRQIRLAPRIQKIGGYCLGYQMSYDDQANQIGALGRIQKAYRNRCSIQYAHVLDDTLQFPAGAFLRAQYASFLGERPDSGNSTHTDRVRRNLSRCLRTVGQEGRFFSLIYYEVRKDDSVATTAPEEVKLDAKPAATWASRIALHRNIVDHTTPTTVSSRRHLEARQ